jgi:predicted kinase
MKKENLCLFILSGEAFSGKTTVAKKIAEIYNAKIIGRDVVYFALDKFLALEKTPENDEDNLWINLWPVALQGVKNQLLIGNHVIYDDNCLRVHQRDELRSIAKEAGAQHKVIYLATSAETIKARKEQNKLTKERHDVPSGWMEEEAVLFERPTKIEDPVVFTENMTLDELLKKIADVL